MTNPPHKLFIFAFGERKSIKEWADDARCKTNFYTLRARLTTGMEPELAISTPPKIRVHEAPLPGSKFGRLTVASASKRGRSTLLHCVCECGTHVDLLVRRVVSGHCKSCGCWQKTNAGVRSLKHGHTVGRAESRLHYIWASMIQRCYDNNAAAYSRYGGRGIEVCEEWRRDFSAFATWAQSNGYSDALTIDRVDNGDGYSPGNCRWATMRQQARNTRRNRHLEAFGETKLLCEWAEDSRCAVSVDTLAARLSRGWNTERAISKPCRQILGQH